MTERTSNILTKFIIILSVAIVTTKQDEVRVSVNEGVLVGAQMKTDAGFDYIEFLQIPYAKPPIGPLRFKSPQPPEPWTGERDAKTNNMDHICFQHMEIHVAGAETRGSEDCLYLNIFTPRLPTNSSEVLPVMIYIHGGGFLQGTGTFTDESAQEYFVEQDIVVVSINYRLGVFGFLSLGIAEAAGNMGLKDQTMALRWVKDNIHIFGGDKHQVTLFGISAGSASVEYQILSHKSRDLFQKAIPQSGSTLNSWAITHTPKNSALHLVRELGYNGTENDVHSIYNLLMEESMESIGAAFNNLVISSDPKKIELKFVPTIETDLENNEAFLIESPYELLKKGNFNKVDVLRGFCEFESFVHYELKTEQIFEKLTKNKNYTDFLLHTDDINKLIDLNKKFNELYFDKYISSGDEQLFALHFLSDLEFIFGIHLAAKLMAEHSVPVYYYEFTYDGNLNMKHESALQKKGAGHGDEMNYIMKTIYVTKGQDKTYQDILTRNRMVRMWANFAKTGDPTPNVDSLLPIKWPRFQRDEQKYLVIDKELSVQEKYEASAMKLFEELYEEGLM